MYEAPGFRVALANASLPGMTIKIHKYQRHDTELG